MIKGGTMSIIIKNTVDGFPVKLTTPSNLSDELFDKVQKAVDVVSIKFKPENLNTFIDNFYYIKKYYTGRLWWRRVYKTEKIKGFYIDSQDDIFNTDLDKIKEIINNADEIALGEGIDHEADFFWKIDSGTNNSVIGYTYKNIIWQYTYKNWANNMTANELAGHLAHELLHKLGGMHQYRNYALRKYTPTYAIGYYVAGRY